MRKSVTGHDLGNMLQETGRADDFLQLKQRSEYEQHKTKHIHETL